MKTSSERAGAAIVCDRRGIITRVAYDTLGILDRCVQSASIVEVFDQASKEKAADFVGAIGRDGGARWPRWTASPGWRTGAPSSRGWRPNARAPVAIIRPWP